MDGTTLRLHLQAVKRGGADPPELKVPPMPPQLHFALPVFDKLGARRPMGETGPRLIPQSEIEAFCRLSGARLRHWERDLLEALDVAWLTAVREAQK